MPMDGPSRGKPQSHDTSHMWFLQSPSNMDSLLARCKNSSLGYFLKLLLSMLWVELTHMLLA